MGVHFQIDDVRAICGELTIRTMMKRDDMGDMRPELIAVHPSTIDHEEITCPDCIAALKVTTLIGKRGA